MLRNALGSLPATLEETYARFLTGIDPYHRDYAKRILQVLIYSEKPLRIEEAVDIVAVDPTRNPSFDPALRIPDPQDLIRFAQA